VLALLTVAMAGTVIGLGVVVNIQGNDQAILGRANSRIDISAPGSQVNNDIAAAQRKFGVVEAIAHENVPVPGSVTPVDLRAQDPHGVYGAPMLRLVSGAWPSGAGQVAVTSSVASIFSVKTGDSWTVNGATLRVVGLVENPKDLSDGFALAAPGQLSSPTSLSLLSNSTGDLGQFHPPGGTVQGIMSSQVSGPQEQRNQALAVLLLDTIGLTFIGLLAVAGFTVLAQRRLRALGMIGALGATDRQVRWVMLANGGGVGIVGATAGTTLGLVVWFALRPMFEHLSGHRIDALRLPWWAVVAGAALAVLTALAASWWPARSAARLPIVAALSGRPAAPQPAHRFALLGTSLAALGFLLLVLSHTQRTLFIVTGIVATTIGMLLLAPLGIQALAAVGPRAPIAIRLALRDLARYQARSGAALAAAGLAVGIASTIAISASAAQADDHSLSGGNLATNQLVVWLEGNPANPSGPNIQVGPASGTQAPDVPSATAVSSARAAVNAIMGSLGARSSLELDTAADLASPVPAGAPPGADTTNVADPITNNGQHGFNQTGVPYVATPSVLSFYRIPAGAIGSNTHLLTSRSDLSESVLISGMGDPHPAVIQVTKLLPNYTSAPNTLITERALATFGLTPEPAGWLLQTNQPLTTGQITDARNQAARAGVTIETRSAPDHSLQQLRDYSTTVGLLVALGVLAMTVGLIRSETAGDLRTLTAAGANGTTRRTLTAATAGALALLGGVLGTATAYLALIAWHWHHLDYLAHPPYVDLAVITFGLPLAALIGGWLLGRTPTSIARRPLE
jgi:putative ABC transport system permease protein